MIGLSRMLLAAVLVVGLVACGGTASPTASTGGATTAPSTVVAPPTHVRIPQIAARSTLERSGMLPDGSPEVPSVHQPMQASWASWSPEPGAPGPAVLYGHVNGEQGGRRGVPGIFADLTKLQPGNAIYIDRADGSTAVFEVQRVKTYRKADLDTKTAGDAAAREVYGNTTGPELRLVTCGGDFDRGARSYTGQVVVFARFAGETERP